MRIQASKKIIFFLVNTIFASLTFIADIYFSTKIALEIPYIAIISSSIIYVGNNFYIKYFAILCSTFVIIGYLFSNIEANTLEAEILNRFEILVMIWITSIILYLKNEAYNSLQNNEIKQRAILDSSSDSVLTINSEGTILSASIAVKKMFDWSSGELINQSLFTLISDQCTISFKEYLSNKIKEKDDIFSQPIEIKVIRKDKQEILCAIKINQIQLPKNEKPLFTVIFRDITESKESEERLVWLSTHDELTSVYNRRFFNSQLIREWQSLIRKELPIALILLDIDFFKQYNDTLGHLAGDSCIQLIAQEIQNKLKRTTDFLARYGGEEFAVVLPDTHIDGAIHIAKLLKKSIYNLKIPHPNSSIAKYVTISLGLTALVPSPQATTNDLIRKADYALYQAKNNGRNCFIAYTIGYYLTPSV